MTVTATKMSLRKLIRTASNVIVFIPSRSTQQTLAFFLDRVEF